MQDIAKNSLTSPQDQGIFDVCMTQNEVQITTVTQKKSFTTHSQRFDDFLVSVNFIVHCFGRGLTQWFSNFLHILPFHQTRFPDLPTMHSTALVYFKIRN